MFNKVDFKEVFAYLAVVACVAAAAPAAPAVPHRGVAVSPPTTLSSNSPASLVDILF